MIQDNFPLQKPTQRQAHESFNRLKDYDALNLLKKGVWSTRYQYQYLDNTINYVDMSNIGSMFSNYYHFDSRMCCDSINSPSPIRSWYNPQVKKSIKNCKIANGDDRVAIALRKYIPSQFRCSCAKFIYQYYKAQNVFDPCAGWGDRLTGALACETVKSYTGLDVNPYLFLGYEKQIASVNTTKNIRMILERAELYESDVEYDLVFTSPPYFDVERYEGIWQSHRKYKKLDIWLKKFLFKMLDNAWIKLKMNGYMLINISDVYAHHTINKICDPMITYMLEKSNVVFEGALGYRIPKRPNTKAMGKIFCEPIWIFKKQINNKLPRRKRKE